MPRRLIVVVASLSLLLCVALLVLPSSKDPHSRLVENPIVEYEAAKARDNTTVLKVMSLNAAHGRGTSFSQILLSKDQIEANLNAIAQYIIEEDPDLVALQEIDAPSWWTGNVDQVRYLAEQSGFAWSSHGINTRNIFGNYGTAILSKHPILAANRYNFAPSPPTPQKGFTHIEVLWQQQRVNVVSMHLDFARRSVRQTQSEAMNDLVRLNAAPSIVMGDFNSQWAKPQSVVRSVANSPHLKAYAVDSNELGSYGNDRIDWIFVSPKIEFVSYRNGPALFSDHRPVIAQLKLKPHKD
ncbi:hypothetical protein DBZ36_01875 [Alginatibacterium sediminis]|uniref:Endonuclease/exonuclease/phosphatase domain-containing protein n=1 Tax=Alginatibacterium sediminis TaxID=2164068 RepID=A0A420EL20_9ALTE|nr:endonuclease/exonuclease/phosphatase family protein [Alginatibacterium sediminis]RKF21421.1 hypothetical protein DBZ36_01875 [Alginatibacterium sediminis]